MKSTSMSTHLEDSPSKAQASGMVLVVDNDESVGGLLVQILEMGGIACERVLDGEAALARLRLGRVAVLVTDLDMPRMGGRELLLELSTWPDAPPSLVVSGFVDAATEAELLALPPVVAILRKPFDLLEFRDQVRGLCRSGSGNGAAPGEPAAQ